MRNTYILPCFLVWVRRNYTYKISIFHKIGGTSVMNIQVCPRSISLRSLSGITILCVIKALQFIYHL